MLRRQLLLTALAGLFLLAPLVRADEKADLKKRFEERYPTLLKLKDAGKVGESLAGQVLTVQASYGSEKIDPADQKSLTIAQFLDLENKDRARLYDLIAKETKQTAEEVAKQNALRNHQNAAPTHFLQVKNAKGEAVWMRKKDIPK